MVDMLDRYTLGESLPSTMTLLVISVLVFSLFLPLLSSGDGADPTSTQEYEPQGWVEEVKEIEPLDIWHSEVEDPSEGPFDTDKSTVTLNLTARGEPPKSVQPFDWMFSMDSSGSMDWNDPNDWRIEGAKHFVDLVEENVSGSRGATIDFDSSAHLVNNRSFTDDYDAIRSDLGTIGASGGTDFIEPLSLALDEFDQHGNALRPWFHLFLTDGQSQSMDWSLVDEHADRGIPIYTIGFGNIDEQVLQQMADMTGGKFYEAEEPPELYDIFESVFEDIYEECEFVKEDDVFDWISSMDSSGSMGWNDPDDLRYEAANHFVDLVEENAPGSRGGTIEFDYYAHLVDNLTDDYDAIRDGLVPPGSSGGTNLTAPLSLGLEEFEENGFGSRYWFHILFTDGQSNESLDWDVVDEYAERGIPIYTIGWGDVDEYLLIEIADRTDGSFSYLEHAEDIEEIFEDILERIASEKTAVESPPEEPMIREVLPPHIEYVEGSAEPKDNFTVYEEDGDTILEWDREKLYINETWEVEYDIRANKYSHELPITAYDDEGEPLSRISYKNVSSGEIEVIPTEGPRLGVHGHPEPVIGASRWEGVEVGEPITFKNMTWDGEYKSSWPGDCEIETYHWDLGDGTEAEGVEVEHAYEDPGTYGVELTATTVDDVSATTTENITVEEPGPANFDVEIVSYDDEVIEGDEASVEYTVTNTGEIEDTQMIEFTVDGTAEDSEEITLEKDEIHEGKFTWETEEAGEYNLKVLSEDDEEQVTINVMGPAFFQVEIVDHDEEVVEGEQVSVEYNVENTGDVEDSKDIMFTVYDDEGEMIYEDIKEDITIGPDELYENEFKWETEEGDVGSYELEVATEDSEEIDETEVLEDVEESYFEVEITGTNVEVIQEPGEPGLKVIVTCNYTVINTGEEMDTQDINFTVYDDPDMEIVYEDNESELTLEPGETYESDFTWETDTTEHAGWYLLEVASEDDEDDEEVQIPSEGNLVTSVLKVEKEDVGPGDEIVMSKDVENTGDGTVDYTVFFVVNGDFVGTDTVRVKSGEMKTVSLTYSIEDEGDYNLEAGEESFILSVEEESEEDRSTPFTRFWLIIPIIAAVIALFIILTKADFMDRKSSYSDPVEKEEEDKD